MKSVKYIVSVLLFIMSGLFFNSCVEEETTLAQAVQTKEINVVFEARTPQPQTISVYADGEWIAHISEDWIEVSPMSGNKNTEVTITANSDNVDSNGQLKAPREGIVIFQGASDERKGLVNIVQKGDTYLGIDEYTVTQVAKELSDSDKAKISSAQVIAVSKNGFVVTDGTTNMYVSCAETVNIGDEIFLNGERVTYGKLPSFKGDEVVVNSNGEVKYPTPLSLSSAIIDEVSYIKVEGTLIGTTLRVGNDNVGKVFDASDNFKISELNVHNVVITGYYIGMVDNLYNIILTSVVDKGIDSTIGQELPFKDDFSWLEPYITVANKVLAAKNQISDCVGNTIVSADGAANLYTTLKNNGCDVLGELRARGYTDLNPAMQTIYLQDQYFKFGATDKQSGLILPLMRMEGEQDIVVSFKWCCHLSAALNVDDVKLVVAIDGPGTVVTASGSSDAKVSDDIASTQAKGEMFWMDASVTITGATKATFITIRPNPIGSSDNKVTGVHRYYLDDIEVMLASDAVASNIKVTGVENNLITFEGSPASPYKFSVSADADYSISSSVKWLHVDNVSGLAGDETEVTVTCDQSDLNVLRQGEIAIKAGISSYKIQVVQSAAGQELAPFISMKTGNNVSVLGEGETFTATVQANVGYEVEILDDWITEVEMPATKALVEYTDHAFTAALNVTGAPRTGRIRFYNTASNVETVLNVNQEAFEPRITVTPKSSIFPAVSGLGGTITFNIDSNIPFTVSADASWIKLPVSQGAAGTFDVPVTFSANTSDTARSAKVTFVNGAYSLVLDVNQYASGVIFEDDFSWLKPLVDAVNPTGADNYDTVGKHDLNAKAPNIYTTAALKAAFVPLCKQIGYVIPGKADGANDVLYLQDCYLKLGKTSSSSQTSLTLPSVDPAGKAMTISFDWARMEQGSGTIDPYTLTLMITGNGTFENGTKYSDELSTPQGKGEMFWTNISAKVSGADKDTKITLVPTDLLDKETGKIDYTVSGGKRAFYDNFVIKVN